MGTRCGGSPSVFVNSVGVWGCDVPLLFTDPVPHRAIVMCRRHLSYLICFGNKVFIAYCEQPKSSDASGKYHFSFK